MTSEIKPVITSIRFYSGPVRKQPKTGDLRETKKHGKQIRVMKMARDHMNRVIGYDCTGGRQRYEWVGYDEARERGYGRHIPEVNP